MLYLGSVVAGGQQDRQYALHDRWLVTYADHPLVQREQIEEELSEQGGKHLVVVRYGTEHDFSDEWVYNRSDIDAAPRDLGSRDGRGTKPSVDRLFPRPPGVAGGA